ncbi:MAG: hypothetical protein WCW65_00275 [Candidatus Paceibacterota bacterium]
MKKAQSHINKGPVSTRFSRLGGFSLVEILVSISIFLIFVVTTSAVIQKVSIESRNSANRERASILAEEGLEAARNIRDANFINLSDGTYGLSTTGNVWSLSGSSDITNIFTRVLNISTINENQKKVDVSVSWADKISAINTVTSSTYFTNWREILNIEVGLTVNKLVINHGGTKVASDFAPYKVTSTLEPIVSTDVDVGVANLFDEGSYIVTETTDPNYTQTFSGDCDGSGAINLVANTVNTCLITNEEKPSNIIVNKVVINHGGTKTVEDFTILVDSNPVVSGVTNTFNSGLHTVSEVADSNYLGTIDGDCDGAGSVTLSPGTTRTCTITNEEIVLDCTDTPWGTMTSGTSNTAYLSSLPVGACTSEIRTCTNGVLSGSYTATTCTAGCTSTPWGNVASGYSNTAYLDSSVNYPSTCTSETRTCTAGIMSGTYTNTTCFVSPVLPTVTTTDPVTSITKTTAVGGGTIVSNGGAVVTVSGLVWSTSINPTVALSTKTTDGWAFGGPWTSSMTGLTANTLYHVRAYATNSVGTSYGSDVTFTTMTGACVVTGIVPRTYDNSSSISAVVTKPTGVVQNDIMFAYIMHNNSTDRLNSIPVGWTQIGRHKNGNSNQALYYKVAGPSEPASYTFGLSSSSRFAVTINAYRGCFNITTPIDTSSNTEYVTSNTTYRAASMNLTSSYTTVIIFPSVNASGAKTFTAPITQSGGWTEDYANGNASSQFSRNAYSKMINTSGLTGVIDSIGFSASIGKHAFAVALHPL